MVKVYGCSDDLVEIDGYTGTLEKEIKLYVRDFERVILTED